MSTDYYALLEVSPQATQDEIKRSFRVLARRYHPDANPDDAEAEARFKELARAYETLSDPERRARYDRFGPDESINMGDPFGTGGMGGLGDLFDAFFSGGGFGAGRRGPTGPPRGPDLEVVADLSFEEAVFGAETEVTVRTAVGCDECEGSGAANGSERGHLPRLRRRRRGPHGSPVDARPDRLDRCVSAVQRSGADRRGPVPGLPRRRPRRHRQELQRRRAGRGRHRDRRCVSPGGERSGPVAARPATCT